MTEKSRGVSIYVKSTLSFCDCNILNAFGYKKSGWYILRLESHEIWKGPIKYQNSEYISKHVKYLEKKKKKKKETESLT